MVSATTPALSVLAIAVPDPTKLMLTGLAEELALDTTSVVVAVCDNVPLVPVTVSVEVPADVLDPTVTVIVELPAPEMVVGENAAVAPVGNPLAPSVTVPVKPFCAVTVAV